MPCRFECRELMKTLGLLFFLFAEAERSARAASCPRFRPLGWKRSGHPAVARCCHGWSPPTPHHKVCWSTDGRAASTLTSAVVCFSLSLEIVRCSRRNLCTQSVNLSFTMLFWQHRRKSWLWKKLTENFPWDVLLFVFIAYLTLAFEILELCSGSCLGVVLTKYTSKFLPKLLANVKSWTDSSINLKWLRVTGCGIKEMGIQFALGDFRIKPDYLLIKKEWTETKNCYFEVDL